MRKNPVSFYSEGIRLVGDLYVPDALPYEVYAEPAFGQLMTAVMRWNGEHLPPRV